MSVGAQRVGTGTGDGPVLRSGERSAFVGMIAMALIALCVSAAELGSLSLAARAVGAGTSGLEAAARLSPLNWNVRLVLGDVAAAAGRPELAARWYREAIARNPACALCSVALAEVETRLGNNPDPWLERAIRYGRSTTSVRVRAGALLARLGRDEEAAREFAAASFGQQENQKKDFFSLLRRIYPDDVVLDRIIPDEIVPSYFAFARSQLDPPIVQRVWERCERLGYGPESRAEYVAYLLRHGLAHQAWTVQFAGSSPAFGKVQDGDFEHLATNSAFSWRVTNGEGVRAQVVDCPDCADRGRALAVRFDGETNVHYGGVWANVPVTPGGLYRLTARVKGSGLTSAQGPALAILGLTGLEQDATHNCAFRILGESFHGTFDWRTTSLVFSVPSACEGVQVAVIRLRTRRLDKFIAGELWVDDVVLEEMVSSVPPAGGEAAEKGALGGSIGAIVGALTGPASGPQSEVEALPR